MSNEGRERKVDCQRKETKSKKGIFYFYKVLTTSPIENGWIKKKKYGVLMSSVY